MTCRRAVSEGSGTGGRRRRWRTWRCSPSQVLWLALFYECTDALFVVVGAAGDVLVDLPGHLVADGVTGGRVVHGDDKDAVGVLGVYEGVWHDLPLRPGSLLLDFGAEAVEELVHHHSGGSAYKSLADAGDDARDLGIADDVDGRLAVVSEKLRSPEPWTEPPLPLPVTTIR